MGRILSGLVLAGAVLVACARADGPSDDELKKKPITTDRGEVGKLLLQWDKEGTAAGNAGDWYDNRDGDHSPLDLRPYPQLRKVVYTPADVKARRHWALQVRTLPHVTFGNSSTSAPPERGGSNPRHAYCTPGGLDMLYKQYRGNNLYVYPEHRDHDPGHNGRGDGYGDLYPANTPYLITSQGSSGSDQPFLRALPFTLAAFRPEVKRKLVDSGLLMPTVQMILRSSNKHLASPKEYLTGKAHPTVFEGSWVDPLKMARAAHAILPGDVPPMIQLKVVEEDRPVNGRDFFEPAGLTERLADTPAAVARVWRGKGYRRRLVVSAEGSYDLNRRPLTYHWVLLRGDPARVTLKPRNKAGSVAEVVVAYHPRRPVAPGAALESNRVDVGVFAHNGVSYSAPGFLTFFSLDSEARAYDEGGRVLEVGHGHGEPVLVPDYGALFETVSAAGPAARVLSLTAAERAALRQAAGEYRRLARARDQAARARQRLDRDRHAAVGEARNEADKVLRAADQQLARRNADLQRFLDGNWPGVTGSPRGFVQRALGRELTNPAFTAEHAADLTALLKSAPAGRRGAVAAARRRLAGLGVAEEGDGVRPALRPARPGPAPLRERLTPYELAQLRRYHAALLAELVLPGAVTASFRANFVDQRLTVPKAWRDVYRHDKAGKLLGWTRYDGAGPAEFTADGLLVLEKDAKGRPRKARTVSYRLDRPYNPFAPGPPLRQVSGDEVVTYEYDGDTARVKSREKVAAEK
jgi:hypothetical protein